MGKIFLIATTSTQKKDSILSKTVNIVKHFERNKFLGQKLKTTDSFQRIPKKKINAL